MKLNKLHSLYALTSYLHQIFKLFNIFCKIEQQTNLKFRPIPRHVSTKIVTPPFKIIAAFSVVSRIYLVVKTFFKSK